MNNEHNKPDRFELPAVGKGDRVSLPQIETIPMLLERQRLQRVKELKRQFAWVNMDSDGVPDGLDDPDDRALWTKYVRDAR